MLPEIDQRFTLIEGTRTSAAIIERDDPITAHRVWLSQDGVYLQAIIWNPIHEPGKNRWSHKPKEAHCQHGCQEIPPWGGACACGYWAVSHICHLRKLHFAIFGSVALWGRVTFDGEVTYRAQYAHPEALYYWDENKEAISDVVDS